MFLWLIDHLQLVILVQFPGYRVCHKKHCYLMYLCRLWWQNNPFLFSVTPCLGELINHSCYEVQIKNIKYARPYSFRRIIQRRVKWAVTEHESILAFSEKFWNLNFIFLFWVRLFTVFFLGNKTFESLNKPKYLVYNLYNQYCDTTITLQKMTNFQVRETCWWW